MGGSLHRIASVRQSLPSRVNRTASTAFLIVGLALAAASCSPKETVSTQRQAQGNTSQKSDEAVAALGQLEPKGDVRRLDAPIAGRAMSPRITELLVDEGDTVTRGQVLARFDNREGLQADLDELDAEEASLREEIAMQQLEISRYTKAAQWGAASLVLLEDKQEELIRLEGRLDRVEARQRGLKADFDRSELLAPLDGLVLDVHAREGERPGSAGVLDLGASQSMQARIEVYESDISRIRLDQSVQLSSENGGFEGELTGRVIQISPQVQQREVLSTDPTGDADARVVEVLIALDDDDARRVLRLAGLKVIARFEP